MKSVNWERLRIFKAVVECGSLANAARMLGLSQPTVSRQVRMLERDLDQDLIDLTPQGAVPTEAGLRIVPAIDDMMRSADSIGVLQKEAGQTPTVRVSCGPWFAALISRHIGALVDDPADAIIEVVSSTAFADLPRREADIAIRNQRASGKRQTITRIPDYSCAVYGARSLVQDREGAFDDRRFSEFDWAALVEELGQFPTARWLSSRLRKRPVAHFSSSINLLDAVRSGRLLAVIPCFAGDPERDIVRISRPFIPDYGGHWLVLADDVRRRPHVRRIADRIIGFVESRRELLMPDKCS